MHLITAKRNNLGFVADSVVKAIAILECKNGWTTGVLPGTLVAPAPSPGSILHHPMCVGWSWGRWGSHKDPCQTKFQFCWVPRMGGIKLQLLCGDRMELAVGSLPYPGMIRIPGSVQDETGKSGFPIVSPVWTWGKIFLGIPTFLPMEDATFLEFELSSVTI